MQFIDLKAQQQHIRRKIEQRMAKVLDHGQYIMGPEIIELEEQLADFVGTKHCITNSSGTDALLLAMMALGIGPDDEVITTPFTFFATGEVISLLGAKMVLVDIDPNTYMINPDELEKNITPRTKAILPVSLYGLCPDFDTINKIAHSHGVAVIEDAAQSFGATYQNKRSCSLSTIGCTSFFPSKPLGCYGDGGACFTNDDNLALAMRELRIHGQEARYHHTRIGINGRLDTLQAAILLPKLEIFPSELELREKVAKRYNEKLGTQFKLQHVPPDQTCVYGQYTIEVANRTEIQKALKDMGIPTAVHYPVPLHLQPVYTHLNLPRGSFPHSERASERVMSIPMHPYLMEEEQDKVIEALLNFDNQ